MHLGYQSHSSASPRVTHASNRARRTRGARPALLGTLLVLAALNLRPAITSVSPLMAEIQQAYGLGPRTGILVIALPVAGLGSGAPLAPLLARRLGYVRTTAIGLFVVMVGLLARALWLPSLFPATVATAAGIAIIAVSLPSVVKQFSPDSSGIWTAVYGLAMAVGAAVAPILTATLTAAGLSLRLALGTWSLVAGIASLAWFFCAPGPEKPLPRTRGTRESLPPFATPLALLFGVQATLFFLIVADLPSFLRSQGSTPVVASSALSAFSAIGLVGSFAVPVLASRLRHQRWLVISFSVLSLAGFASLVILGKLWLGVVLLGLGQGSVFPLAITLFVIRARNVKQAGALSAFSQGVGFVGAAIVLFLLTQVFVSVGSWYVPWGAAMALVGVQVVSGWFGAGPPTDLVPETPLDVEQSVSHAPNSCS